MESNQTIHRPWGTYIVIDKGNGYLVKTITVYPHQKLSVQKHYKRCEHWIVLSGQAKILKGNTELFLNVGDCADIAIEEIHSIENPFQENLKILEVQRGETIDENDIERLSDIYGRV
jgi:mannose-6-phosphate isomerase-like protein (cupin superfamily)